VAGLAVVETTNGNFNQSLWGKLHTDSVLSWMRVSRTHHPHTRTRAHATHTPGNTLRAALQHALVQVSVANALGTSVGEWLRLFSTENSGTYNDQVEHGGTKCCRSG
jgi:hypothetical protein